MRKNKCSMKQTSIFVLLALLFSQELVGQNRTLYGRVLSEELESLPRVVIMNPKDSILGETDMEGRFEIEVPQTLDSLSFGFIGMEPAEIKLNQECDQIEIIIMYDGLYHYKSHKRIDRIRKKRFNEICNLHAMAVKEGLFESKDLCYHRSFKPEKQGLDEIRKYMKQVHKENLNDFKDLQIGELVEVPLGFDSQNQRVNTYYSICGTCTESDYKYVIEGEIINKFRKRLTLELKVTKMLPYDSIEYQGKTLKNDSTFKYQMKYFDVIIKK